MFKPLTSFSILRWDGIAHSVYKVMRWGLHVVCWLKQENESRYVSACQLPCVQCPRCLVKGLVCCSKDVRFSVEHLGVEIEPAAVSQSQPCYWGHALWCTQRTCFCCVLALSVKYVECLTFDYKCGSNWGDFLNVSADNWIKLEWKRQESLKVNITSSL